MRRTWTAVRVVVGFVSLLETLTGVPTLVANAAPLFAQLDALWRVGFFVVGVVAWGTLWAQRTDARDRLLDLYWAIQFRSSLDLVYRKPENTSSVRYEGSPYHAVTETINRQVERTWFRVSVRNRGRRTAECVRVRLLWRESVPAGGPVSRRWLNRYLRLADDLPPYARSLEGETIPPRSFPTFWDVVARRRSDDLPEAEQVEWLFAAERDPRNPWADRDPATRYELLIEATARNARPCFRYFVVYAGPGKWLEFDQIKDYRHLAGRLPSGRDS